MDKFYHEEYNDGWRKDRKIEISGLGGNNRHSSLVVLLRVVATPTPTPLVSRRSVVGGRSMWWMEPTAVFSLFSCCGCDGSMFSYWSSSYMDVRKMGCRPSWRAWCWLLCRRFDGGMWPSSQRQILVFIRGSINGGLQADGYATTYSLNTRKHEIWSICENILLSWVQFSSLRLSSLLISTQISN